MEYKVEIDGVTYDESKISSVAITRPLFQSFSAGNACASKVEVAFLPDVEPPSMSTIIPYCRESADAEWSKCGVFFADERTEKQGLKTIIGYDAMLKAEVEFLGESSGGEWPRQMSVVVNEIAGYIGVEVDARTSINADYMLAYPLKYTMRELLQHIGVANGGNWVITSDGKLYMVPLFPAEAPTNHNIGMAASSLERKVVLPAISGIEVKADDEYSYFAGDDTGYVMKMTCPSITQEMVNNILLSAAGYVYRGYKATGVYLPPSAELGDTVTIDDFTGIIAEQSLKFGSGHMSDVSAPGDKEVEHEYSASSTAAARDMERKLAQTKAEIQVKTDEIILRVDGTDERVSQIDQKVDGISMSVSGPMTDGKNTYVAITLSVDGRETSKGYVTIDGNVTVSGQLSADALYSSMGDIAKLRVDSLSTSRRIPKYLASDTSDDNYIDIEDKHIRLMRGVTDGSSEQARNPNGELIYWEADISDASIGSDGYPYKNGVRIFTTNEATDYPVMVYVYEDFVRREMTFNDDEYKTPIDVFGHGYGLSDPDRGKGFIQKNNDSFNIWLVNRNGEDRGVFIRDDYVDIVGMRKTSGLNFSEWDNGRFYERIDGDDTRYEYNVEFDANNRPVKIKDSTGHELYITW